EETQKVDKKVTFSITTNGTLLDDEKIQFLADHKINVMLSFDGTKELQDAQRPYASGRGSYDLVLPKIQKLLKVAPNTTGHSVIVGNTSPEIVKDALQEIGFRRVSVAMNSQSLFDEKDEEKTLIRNTQSMFHVLDEEAKAWRELIKDRNVLSLKRLMGRSNLYGAILHLLNQSKKRYFCGAGRSMVSVTPSSDIYLCHRFVGLDEYKVGNLNHSTLNLDAFIQSPVETNTECIKCSARYYCGGGCKHDHVSASGSINHPEENMCKIKRHELELAASIVRDLSHEEGNWLIKEKIFPPKPCPLDL
ncbi:MAG: SPASM domain-containing protein, partial [Clostridiales bacterium]|nr:SPASM domain-containing protein [Clostridiales bacterium]